MSNQRNRKIKNLFYSVGQTFDNKRPKNALALNPLTAFDGHYIGHLIGRMCRRRSDFHRQNHEKRPRIFRNLYYIFNDGIRSKILQHLAIR